MRLDNEESKNIEDYRGESGSKGGGFPVGGTSIGIGTVALALVAMYFGVDPSVVFQAGQQAANHAAAPQQSPKERGVKDTGNVAEDEVAHFVARVLGSTEYTWSAILRNEGQRYVPPVLAFYTGGHRTACGLGKSAMGPFYCPGDRKIYIDLSFYEDLKRRYQAPGDFAQAYVIAHEVGHHVQHLLRISDEVHQRQKGLDKARANALSVRLELQADCFAGVWAYHANRAQKVLEPGDVEEALAAATAIGDDRLQQEARGYAVPESFTHGTSQQRVNWFKRGLNSGTLQACDTFRASRL